MSEAKKPQQVPSIGRVVHYVAHGSPNGEHPAGAHRAAIITEVYDAQMVGSPAGPSDEIEMGRAGLCVLNPSGFYFLPWAPFDPTATQPGSWHWPEFVPSR